MSWRTALGAFGRRTQTRHVALRTLLLSAALAAVAALALAAWLHGTATETLLLAPLVCLLVPVAAFAIGVAAHPTDALDTRIQTPLGVRPSAAAATSLLLGFAQPPTLLFLAPYAVLAGVLPAPLPLRLGAAGLGWAGCVLAYRLGVRAGRALIVRRVSREVGSAFWYAATLLSTVVLFGLLFLPWQRAVDDAIDVIASVLEWVPGANLALVGAEPRLLPLFAVTGAVVLVLLVLEWLLARRDGVHAMSAHAGGTEVDLGTLRFAPANATWVIAARTWLAWVRDSRYRLMLLTIAVLPPLLVIPVAIAGVATETLLLLPLPIFALLFGWSLHNDTAYDSTALWLHVTGGLPGRADRLGRAIPTLVTGSLLIAAGALLVWWISEDAHTAALVAAVSLGLLGTGVGGSSIMSALSPYPVAHPGDSPWSQPVTTWGGSFAVHGVCLLIELGLCLPAIWLAVTALQTRDPALVGTACAVAVGTGVVVAVLGILIGGAVFTARRTLLLNQATLEG